MKEANYHHLRLDNFNFNRDDLVEKSRNIVSSNKENIVVGNQKSYKTLSSPFGVSQSLLVNDNHNVVGVPPTTLSENVGYPVQSNNYISPVAVNSMKRTPLSNISNSCRLQSGSISNSKKPKISSKLTKDVSNQVDLLQGLYTGKSCLTTVGGLQKNPRLIDPEVAASSTSRLFEENLKDRDYENLEHSIIAGSSDEEEDLFWDDDYIFNDEEENVSVREEEDCNPPMLAVPDGYSTLGPPTASCPKCHAIMWKEERVNKNVKRGAPKFSICCSQGQIKLPPTPSTPSYLMQLYNDPKKSRAFKRNIKLYNAMFAFTSMGGKVDHSINSGRAPYVYRLNGQNHHIFGTLIPNEGDDPKYCQLYIYDTENEVQNRMKWVKVNDGTEIEAEIVEGLVKMLDETNQLVERFRYARDRFKEQPIRDLRIKLKVCRSESGRENNIGPSDEVAAVLVGDEETTVGVRDIILEKQNKELERISTIHPSLMALQYPLLFPNGEDGYHEEIPYVDPENQNKKKRKRITMKEYYAYKLQVRLNEAMHVRLGGRLFQQYVVDAFSCIEQSRLWWLRTHQTNLRNDLYTNIAKNVCNGNVDSSTTGKGFVLPANFLGSKRYMQQNFQDALAVCRNVGHPDIFLTMTCNPQWDEIQQMMKLLPGCSSPDSPDIIARVFRQKLDQLLDDIKKKHYFGVCIGVMYVVEFQKRGLPHIHMLIWLNSDSKKNLASNVDKFVSAELPNPDTDPIGYAAVQSFMIHGPCGSKNLGCQCMKNFKCSKHFPKKYQAQTTFDQSGFPIYKRRKTNITASKGKCDLDNQWVVPYSRDLLVKYQCHMNVEICCHARSLKYLFKYCLKGHDRATVEITAQNQEDTTEGPAPVDEIKAYFDGRYICASEAAYRIFGFPIHYRSISVHRLAFHLPGQKSCTFRDSESLEKVVSREKHKRSPLEAFFELNRTDSKAREYTYDEIPQHYVWNYTDMIWTTRKRGKQFGRLLYAHHSSGELWYLRLLLSKIRGPTSFDYLKKINGVQYKTFKDACLHYGLLDDDNEWEEVLSECAKSGLPIQVRQLFVHIIVNCQVTDLRSLWKKHWKHMIDDIILGHRNPCGGEQTLLNDKQLEFYALAEIDKLLRSIGKSLKQYSQLPLPPSSYLQTGSNNLVIDETSYNMSEMAIEFDKLFPKCNAEQLQVYNTVLQSVEKNEGGLFFVYGSGGCGKTFVWKTIIFRLRSMGLIVLPVASSGIAATLLPGGRTAHSRFKIPIVLDEYSSCGIGHDSDIAELIKRTSLIIWDEAPMQHRYAFECLDRSLRDIMRSVDPKRYNIPFGGITVLLGGDFRQILPVINLGSRGDVVSSCITRSYLWHNAHILVLKQNMRLNQGQTEEEIQSLKQFAEWVLKIGNGTVPPPNYGLSDYHEDDIVIPPQFCDPQLRNDVETMIGWTYPDFISNYKSPQYLSQRAILTPTNQIVGHLNSAIVDTIPGETFSYFSVDSAEEFGGTASDLSFAFPPEYLNSINIPGLPPNELKLKVGVAVMLMRNLNQTLGLCNGTRMIVTRCFKQCVECEVICGTFVGTKHFIPRMELSPTETKLPFKLIRKQMPLQVCYSMTINKSQGQSLERVGLFLPNSVFTHGQLYVAVSRVTSAEGLKIFIDSNMGGSTNITQNVVYKEVFYNLPRV